jgi:hypothetical protein
VTQKVVAELLGTSRQALNPVLKKLEQGGLVRLGYGEVIIEEHDRIIQELRRTADGSQPDASSASSWAV